jgi:hypothetical protein
VNADAIHDDVGRQRRHVGAEGAQRTRGRAYIRGIEDATDARSPGAERPQQQRAV